MPDGKVAGERRGGRGKAGKKNGKCLTVPESAGSPGFMGPARGFLSLYARLAGTCPASGRYGVRFFEKPRGMFRKS